ncbi:MAG: cytochrome C [Geobacter sp.]|nr:MAG: cytochrome C [Geobacter sp.]
MRRSLSVILATGIGVTVALIWSYPRAELVDHHGIKVEADSSTTNCLSCHDGLLEQRGVICTTECNFRTPHRVLMHYPPFGKEDKFMPTQVIAEKGIFLENGNVGCTSCHNLRNGGKAHLVMSNGESILCRTCHIK